MFCLVEAILVKQFCAGEIGTSALRLVPCFARAGHILKKLRNNNDNNLKKKLCLGVVLVAYAS